ncbi:MAG: DUF3570 domain-containing protein [Agarilytica sp.]
MAVTSRFYFLTILIAALSSVAANAAVLPEDRSDILFHQYEGDDSTFNGPSILVRKGFKDTVSAWANYYVDFNSAASIDVVTQGSPYKEQRVETSFGADYLYNKTVLSTSFTNSSENDYEADSFSLGLSQEFFGDLSTFTMNYAKGEDDIYQNRRNGPGAGDIIGRDFQGNAHHQRFAIGWTQILTKNWITSFNAEASIDEGFLRNPYRSVRIVNAAVGGNDQFRETEIYPATRSSQAYAVKSMYYLPWRSAVKLEYRTFNDSWQIEANNYEIKYTHPFKENWIFDIRYRFYDQTQASFYREFFDFAEQFDFRASDKELSTFSNTAIGFGVTWEFIPTWAPFVDRATLNFYFDYVDYQYDNFLDKRQSVLSDPNRVEFGEEDPFSFTANISRLFLSIWY